ncbi:protein-disulfide reductase DsbD [Acidocella sp.]|uniref:protein-disulfide reductase DsbD family protein n=1 Tax=Acidocella sp. TaxID=50710 RepID=UPI002624005F|nr:thioredoxin family protein [Acidocella sp.]
MRHVILCLALLLLPGFARAQGAGGFTSPRDQVELVATGPEVNGTRPLALAFTLAPGWHIYWQNPGDAGYPPRLAAPAPVTLSALRFPAPSYLNQDGVGVYVLSGHVLLPFTAHGLPASAAPVTLTANWLVCADLCVPEHAALTVPPPSAPAQAAPPPIIASPFAASFTPGGTLTIAGLGANQVAAARFFPLQPGQLDNTAPQRLSFTANGIALHLPLTGPAPSRLAGVLELTDPSGATQALSLDAPRGTAPAHAPYWLLALLGGLVLNLMPCVFPILAMKALAFARLGGAAPGHVRREALGYGAGVLASMLVLAGLLLTLRVLGHQIFWGFQFQSPVFVALAGWVMLAAGLNMAGWFQFLPPGFIRHLPAQHSFLTGLLAVAVATPCTAPFMGTAVAAALNMPVLPALGLFAALGLGLALPILVLAFIPSLAHLLPRPGRWMLMLQRLLSLPLLGGFFWLAWVLFHQSGQTGLMIALLGGVFLAAALRLRPAMALAVLVALPFLRSAPAAAGQLTLPGAAPYSAARLASLRAAGQPVFIDLTAAWCVTCLVNETTTLAAPQVQALFAARHVALLVGDWTDRDPAITALLVANHRAGVPLYLYYPAGDASPRVLPQLLSPAEIAAVLAR